MSKFHVEQIETQVRAQFADTEWTPGLDDVANLSRCLGAYGTQLVLGSLDGGQRRIEITDGSGDHGIDAIGVDRGAKVVVLTQAKWRRDGSGSMSLGDMLKFLSGVRSILGMKGSGSFTDAGDDIRQGVGDLLKTPGARIILLTVTTASDGLAPAVSAPLVELMDQLNDLPGVEPLARHVHLGQKDLFSSLAEPDRPQVELLVQLLDWGRSSGPLQIFYGRVTANHVAQWHADRGADLFAENIRVMIPRSDINEGIKRTLSSEPERFLYYNNGITVIARQIQAAVIGAPMRDAGTFKLVGASVVNGAQTVSALSSLLGTELESHLQRAEVFVRCIEVLEGQYELGQKITRFANTQNEVSSQDFAFLDHEQHRLAAELRVLGYEYLIRAAEQPRLTERSKVIELREAAVALACASQSLNLSVVAKREVSRLFSESSVYKALFNPATGPERLVRSVIVMREVDRVLDGIERGTEGIRNGIAVHGRTVLGHLVMRDPVIRGIGTADEQALAKTVGRIPSAIAPMIDSLVRVFPENSYPGNVFKNQKRVEELLRDARLIPGARTPSRSGTPVQDDLFSFFSEEDVGHDADRTPGTSCS